ncbi:MAG: long-subunit fatty acid transport protein [Salibacteraceae bacterium]|jgi:long-subunit fatty acid transport protein
MKQFICSSVLILVAFLLAPVLNAKDQPNLKPTLHEIWTGFTLSKDLSKKFSVDLEDQVRFSEALGGLRLNFLDLGLTYRINKVFDAKVNYRYSFRSNVRNTKRISFDLSYKVKIKPVKVEIKMRTRFQNTQVTYTGESTNYLRNKLTLYKSISKKWEGYMAYEIFHNMSDENELHATRFVVGTKFKLNKNLKLKAFLQYDQDVHGKYQPKRYVLGVMGTYEFK